MKRRGSGEGSIFQRMDGRYVGQVNLGVQGGRRRYRLVYGKTRREVVEALKTLLHDQQTGTLPTAGRLTVGEYLETWLDASSARVRESTLLRYRQIVKQQILPAIGRVNLTKLQPVQVSKMLADLHRSGLSAQTCHHTRAVLRAALHDAQRDGLVVRNAASLAREPKVESFRVEPMTPSQARAILEVFADTDLGPLVATALWTGLRQSELLGLRWGDIDLAAPRLSVRVTLQRRAGAWHVQPTKTDKSRRTVTIPEPLVEVLSEHRQRQREAQLRAQYWETSFGDLVFTSDYGQPIMASSLSHRFHDLQVAADLKPVRFHDLRHAAATLMIGSGVDLKVVSELLGHSTIATTANVYAGVLDSLKVDAAERMTRFVSSN